MVIYWKTVLYSECLEIYALFVLVKREELHHKSYGFDVETIDAHLSFLLMEKFTTSAKSDFIRIMPTRIILGASDLASIHLSLGPEWLGMKGEKMTSIHTQANSSAWGLKLLSDALVVEPSESDSSASFHYCST